MANRSVVTVRELRYALFALDDQDAVVYVSSDEEGNSINPIGRVSRDPQDRSVTLWPNEHPNLAGAVKDAVLIRLSDEELARAKLTGMQSKK